jgi:hypothetical protein
MIMVPTTHVMRKDSDTPKRGVVGRLQRTSAPEPGSVTS